MWQWDNVKSVLSVVKEWVIWLWDDGVGGEREPTLFSQAVEYVDLHYLRWLFWFFFPALISFLLPIILCLLLLGNAMFLHVYKLRHRIREAYGRGVWSGAVSAVSSFWDAQGWICHGYEIYGLEHIPESGPALIIYYHGTLPMDVYYVLAKLVLYKNRTMRCVADKFLWNVPGLGLLLKVFQATPGDRKSLVGELKKDQLICISPGGMREALFSHDYRLMWGKRRGFVRVALEANVPVIPMFTENCRQALWTPAIGQKVWRWLYEKTRLPLVPIFGYAPVKFRTYLGAPITSHLRNFTRQKTFGGGHSALNGEYSANYKTQAKSAFLRKARSEAQNFDPDDMFDLDPDSEAVLNENNNGHTGTYTAYFQTEENAQNEENQEEKRRKRIEQEDKLRTEIAESIQDLVWKYQRQPGSMILGLLDRIPGFPQLEKRYFRNRRMAENVDS